MDRLLSEKELKDTYCGKCSEQSICAEHRDKCDLYIEYMPQAKKAISAQLAKADKEWVEWGESLCPDRADGTPKCLCYGCWAERKKGIGI